MGRTRNSDRELARRAVQGEAAAWNRLIDLYGPKIYNVALQFARTPAEAEDLTQEIFLKLYRNLERYRGDVPLIAWTLRLSKNLCIEQYRRTRKERCAGQVPLEVLDGLPSGHDPQAEVQRRLRLQAVHRAMAHMSRDLALPVLLRDLQGLSYEEVATALDIPMGTLKSRLVRARRELAKRVVALLAPGARQESELQASSTRRDLAEVGSC